MKIYRDENILTYIDINSNAKKALKKQQSVVMDATFALGVVGLDLCDHFLLFIFLVSVCPGVFFIPRVECGQVCR